MGTQAMMEQMWSASGDLGLGAVFGSAWTRWKAVPGPDVAAHDPQAQPGAPARHAAD